MPEQSTFSAKQVATRIGTDAKTLRKFLRSPSSPYEAVGQGSRYEFPQDDLKKIKKAFDRWQSKKRVPAKPAEATPTPTKQLKVRVNDEIEMSIDIDGEPSADELAKIQKELEEEFPEEEFDVFEED